MSWYLSQFIRFALQRYNFFPNYAIVGTTFLLSKRNILQFSLFQNAIFYNFRQFRTRYFTILLRQLSRHLMSVLRSFYAILCRLKPNFPLFCNKNRDISQKPVCKFVHVKNYSYLCSRKGVGNSPLHGSPTQGCLRRYARVGLQTYLRRLLNACF